MENSVSIRMESCSLKRNWARSNRKSYLDGAEDYAVANTVAKHERKVTCGLFMLPQEEHDINFGGAEGYFT